MEQVMDTMQSVFDDIEYYLRGKTQQIRYHGKQMFMKNLYKPLFILFRQFGLVKGKTYVICDQSKIRGKELEDLENQTITGKQLKEIIGDMPLLKFMNNNDRHFEMTYKTGVNKDVIEFDNTGCCSSGGIYVTTLGHSHNYSNSYGDFARRVHIDDDALIYIESSKLKCNKVTLDEKKLKDELMDELFSEYVRNKNVDQIAQVLSESPTFIKFFELNESTEELFMETVKKDVSFIRHIDFNRCMSNLTSNIAIELVRYSWTLLQHIPNKLKNYDMIMIAIEQNKNAILYINGEMMTEEIIMAVIKKDDNLLNYIDGQYLTQRIVTDTLCKYPKSLAYFLKHGKKFITESMIIDVMKIHGLMIKILETDEITPQIVMESVKQNGLSIQYVPEKLRTRDVIMEAVRQNGLSIQFIKRSERTREVIVEAVKQNRDAAYNVTKDDMVLLIVDDLLKID